MVLAAKTNQEFVNLHILGSGVDSDSGERLILISSSTDSEIELKPEPEVFDEDLDRLYEMVIWREHLQHKPSAPLSAEWYLATEEYHLKHQVKAAINLFKKSIRRIKAVVKIAYTSSGNTIIIWTLLEKLDRKPLYQVYNIEQDLILKYPSLFFDFTALVSTAEPIPSNFTQEEFK